ncbi:MAG: flagellar export protein FliJ [Pseudomonadota bacterium]|nr:flagellar export protein FliJ [Pseudomonadota bacterium]
MKTFTFKLQTVLDARKAKEEQTLAEYTEQTRLLEKERESLARMGTEKERLLRQLREDTNRLLNPADIDLRVSYIKVWNRKMAMQESLVLTMAQDVEKKRHALLETVKDRKIMENLKERHWKEYLLQQAMQERLMADETAVQRHGRKDK